MKVEKYLWSLGFFYDWFPKKATFYCKRNKQLRNEGWNIHMKFGVFFTIDFPKRSRFIAREINN